MECKEVRDRFSSLLEGDLKPPEDERVRKHLASCEDCQKEWEQFNRMMGWLHTVEEEEVPEGFLSEIQKKREERKGKEVWTGAWFLRSAKIPIQAAAMVMIIFLALYLNKMTPFETLQKKAVEKPDVVESSREKKEEMASPKEMAKAEEPHLREKRKEPDSVGTVRMSLAKKSVREITLKTSDRENAFAQVQGLAKRMGGEVTKEDGDVLLASLPASAYAEFEKELAQIGFPPAAPKPAAPKEIKEDLRPAAGAKSEEQEERGRELSRPMALKENTISIRIRLILE